MKMVPLRFFLPILPRFSLQCYARQVAKSLRAVGAPFAHTLRLGEGAHREAHSGGALPPPPLPPRQSRTQSPRESRGKR